MAWPSSRAVWGRLLPGIQRDIALIASTIARYEPVIMCADAADVEAAREACGRGVEVIGDVPVDDCWMRDIGPVFTLDQRGALGAIGLNFNGWGDRQIHGQDQHVAEGIAALVGVPLYRADIVAEGGAVVTDGAGTLLATESSIINDNRNPGRTKADLTAVLTQAYGAEEIIWLPGVRDKDITDDHVDATSTFIEPGQVLVQVAGRDTGIWAEDAAEQREILERSADARGEAFEVAIIHGPSTVRSSSRDFLDSYVNFYPANGAVITTEFGDPAADRAASATLAHLFPGREVVQLDLDRLYGGGGGVHCVTQQQPTA
jgi:agmatine deiminase